jgi:adenine phosphoribosyltransferase
MSDAIDLKDFIRDVPDFPEPGILFRDVTPLLKSPPAFRATIERLCEYVRSREPDVIVGIESRGFIFGTPIAAELGLPFVPVRKPGKLPAARMSVEYSLEYGTGQLDIHADAIERGQRVVIVDDLLATGGTALGAAKLVEMIRGRVTGMAFVIELAALPGRERLEDYDVFAAVVYD